MVMIVFMGMDIAMLLACYAHAISVIINMVMEMSLPLPCHGHCHVMAIANLVGRTMISAKHIAKAISLAKVMEMSDIKILDKVMKFSRS